VDGASAHGAEHRRRRAQSFANVKTKKKNGMMEYWSFGVMANYQHSTTAILHHSINQFC
jgi:hypothetical protein